MNFPNAYHALTTVLVWVDIKRSNLRHSSVTESGGWVLKLRLQSSVPGRGQGLGAETAWGG